MDKLRQDLISSLILLLFLVIILIRKNIVGDSKIDSQYIYKDLFLEIVMQAGLSNICWPKGNSFYLVFAKAIIKLA